MKVPIIIGVFAVSGMLTALTGSLLSFSLAAASPVALADTLIEDVIALVQRHSARVRPHTLVSAVDWRTGGEVYRAAEPAAGSVEMVSEADSEEVVASAVR